MLPFFRRSTLTSSLGTRRPSNASTITTSSLSMSTSTIPGSSAQPSPSASAISIPAPEQPAFCDSIPVVAPRGSRFSEALKRAKRQVENNDVDGLDFNYEKSLQSSKLSWHTI